MSDEYFAEVRWTSEDVRCLAEDLHYGDITDEQAKQWLNRNAKHIRDRLTELGWGVMETLMSLDHPDGSGQK
jgi:hypothetical protein